MTRTTRKVILPRKKRKPKEPDRYVSVKEKIRQSKIETARLRKERNDEAWAFLEELEKEEQELLDEETALSDFGDVETPALKATLRKKKDDNKVWEAQPGAQVLFLTCPYFEVLLAGPRGGGKTDALLMDFLQHVGVGWGPDWRGVLFRETYPQLDDVKKKCRKWIPQLFPQARFNKNDHTWTFPDGEQLLLRHMKTVEDYYSYHGHEYPWIGWEELTNWSTPDCYKLMMSCCRSSVDPKRRDKYGRPMPRKYRATTNPYGRGHSWCKRRFQLPQMFGKVLNIEEEYDGGTKEIRPRIAIHSPYTENIKLSTSEPDYIKNIQSAARNPAEEAAWVQGTWDITSGGMFDDIWDAKCHVIEPFDIPSTWRIDRSFDWGSSKPASVGWWAESDGGDVVLKDGKRMSTVKGDLFRIAEWYVAYPGSNKGLKKTPHEISEGIVLRELSMKLRNRSKNRVKIGPADSSIWDDSGGPSIAAQMLSPVRVDGVLYTGIQWQKADKKPGSRKNGWEAIRQRLLSSKRPENGIREKQGLFVFNTCTDFCATVPILPRDEKDPDDVDTDSEDHIADETRYRVMTPKREVKWGRTRGNF